MTLEGNYAYAEHGSEIRKSYSTMAVHTNNGAKVFMNSHLYPKRITHSRQIFEYFQSKTNHSNISLTRELHTKAHVHTYVTMFLI